MDEELRSERITIMMAPSDVRTVDDWSFNRRIRSRGEAIRQLIERGLEACRSERGEEPEARKAS